ncbi:MAG TPA: MFS transporter [Methanoregula sp.]|nr:MFS transporter [Methanoregula sp.]
MPAQEHPSPIGGDIDEAAIDRKVWWHIVPFVALLLVIAILDRVNLGYAALTMNADLGIDPALFGFISGIFFISYIICEVPSNQILVRTGARVWLTRIMISWGIITVVTAFVQTPVQLAILRFLLGAAEAGFTPGIMLYLTFWFGKHRISQALCVFFIAIPLSMVIASPVSTLILSHAAWFGLASWRWLFIFEGIPAMVFGALILVYLQDTPSDARWLDGRERAWLSTRMDAERVKKETPRAIPFRQLIATPSVLLLCTSGFIVGLFLTALLFWLPQIVQSSGLSGSIQETGLLVMVPYALSVVVMYLWSRRSDRLGERRWHIAIPLMSAALFLILLAVPHTPLAGYLFLSGAIASCYAAYAPFFVLVMEAFAPGVRASGVALVNAIASIGSFAGPVILGLTGGEIGGPHTVVLCLALGISITVCAILMVRKSPGVQGPESSNPL